jgi:hypothetical protein
MAKWLVWDKLRETLVTLGGGRRRERDAGRAGTRPAHDRHDRHDRTFISLNETIGVG